MAEKDDSQTKEAANSTAAKAAGSADAADIEKNKIFAAISYLGILWVVPLLAAKDSRFAMYHANQGLVLFLFEAVLYFIAGVTFVGFLLYPVIWIGGVILTIIGIVNALGGKMTPLPLIGGIKILK